MCWAKICIPAVIASRRSRSEGSVVVRISGPTSVFEGGPLPEISVVSPPPDGSGRGLATVGANDASAVATVTCGTSCVTVARTGGLTRIKASTLNAASGRIAAPKSLRSASARATAKRVIAPTTMADRLRVRMSRSSKPTPVAQTATWRRR